MINVMISDKEMMDFLIKHGWNVYEDIDSVSENIHGSKVVFDEQKVWKASKEGTVLNVYRAFEKELKNKILQL